MTAVSATVTSGFLAFRVKYCDSKPRRGFGTQKDDNKTNKVSVSREQQRKRSALEKKKAEEEKEFGAIDYDVPVESEKKTVGLGTKIGVGVAVVVFGLVFALGDFLPSGSGL